MNHELEADSHGGKERKEEEEERKKGRRAESWSKLWEDLKENFQVLNHEECM